MTAPASFEQLMEMYHQLPEGPEVPSLPEELDGYSDDEMLNGIGAFKGYLWQEAERQIYDALSEFPLVVEALTCSALFDRDPAEALSYVSSHADAAKDDPRVYDPEIIEALVDTTEWLPRYVDITPPWRALAFMVPGEWVMHEVDRSEEKQKEADAHAVAGIATAYGIDDWRTPQPVELIAAVNRPGDKPTLPSPDPEDFMD